MSEQQSQTYGISVEEIYRQQYAHFSRMNDLFYKLPIGFSTIVGGLWYFGASMIDGDKFMSVVVFIFSAICCLSFLLMTERFGAAFNAYINNLNKMDGELKITIQKARWRSSKRVIMFLLFCGFVLSIFAAIYASYFQARQGSDVSPQIAMTSQELGFH